MMFLYLSVVSAVEMSVDAAAGAEVEHKLMAGVSVDHARGLELEHSQATWPLDTDNGDEAKLVAIREFVNAGRPDGDMAFRWENGDAMWTYGLVRLTATGAREAMALHMLHRHGLAPLLASRDPTFDTRLRARTGELQGDKWLEVFVQTEEEGESVQRLFDMLLEVSLFGLRNLHSYDHNGDWFGAYTTDRLKQRRLQDLGSLQVCHSDHTITWMTNLAVGSHVIAARAAFTEMINSVIGRLPNDMMSFLTPNQHNVTVHEHAGMTADASTFLARVVEAGWLRRLSGPQLQATVRWEEAYAGPSEVTIALTPAQVTDLEATRYTGRASVAAATAAAPAAGGDDAETKFAKKAYAIMQDYVVGKVSAHREEMERQRLVVWAGEEAEIYQVALQVQSAMAGPGFRGFVETDAKSTVRRH